MASYPLPTDDTGPIQDIMGPVLLEVRVRECTGGIFNLCQSDVIHKAPLKQIKCKLKCFIGD